MLVIKLDLDCYGNNPNTSSDLLSFLKTTYECETYYYYDALCCYTLSFFFFLVSSTAQ